MTPTTRFLIGAPLLGSEAFFIRRLARDLQGHGDVLIFANFEVCSGSSSVQIDCVAVTAQRAELVEVKALVGPVSGSLNGPWRLRDFSGNMVEYPGANPWSQACQAKFALNDAMREYQKNNPAVPPPSRGRFFSLDACVCIFPELDTASKLPAGNFKAWIRSYPDLVSALRNNALPPNWSVQDWYNFGIRHLRLQPSSLAAATDPTFAVAEHLLGAYREKVRSLALAGRGDLLRAEPNEMCGEPLVQRLLGHENYLLLGSSGIGKSHHIAHVAARSVDTMEVPLLAEARHYKGNLNGALRKSLSPCTAVEPVALLEATRRTGYRPLLIVDGLNYCSPELLKDLLLDLLSFQTRYGARIVAATQQNPDLPGGLSFEVVQIASLRLDHKEQIFRFHSHVPATSEVKRICESFPTAYDLEIVAKSATSRATPPIRSEAYDRYCREMSPPGFKALTVVFLRECAAIMDHNVTYVFPRDEFDEFAEAFVEKHKVSLDFLDALSRCRLLNMFDDVVYFEHDLLRDYLAADALWKRVRDVNSLASELARPKHHNLAEFIVPRFASADDIDLILNSVRNSQTLADCLRGYLGPAAQERLLSQARLLIEAARADLPMLELHYQVFDRENRRPALVWPTLVGARPCSDYDTILCDAIVRCIDINELTSSVLEFLDAGEQTLRMASKKAAEAVGGSPLSAWDEAIRVFWLMESPENRTPLTRLLSSLRRRFSLSRSQPLERHVRDALLSRAGRDQNADFALLILLNAAKVSDDLTPDERIPLFLAGSRSLVSVIRSEAVQMIHFSQWRIHREAPGRVQQIVERLEEMTTSDLLTNTCVIEALSAYGALESPVSADTAADEMAQLLDRVSSDSEDGGAMAQEAYSLIGNIFEDIYQNVYYDAYEALSESDKVKLLCLAASVPTIGFYTSWILHHLLQLKSKQSYTVFRRFASGIEVPSSMPQESVAVFLFGVAGCAKLDFEDCADTSAENLDQRAWQLVGRLFFLHLSSRERAADAEEAIWLAIEQETPLAIADVLYQITQTRYETESIIRNWDVPLRYPRRVCPLLENSILERSHLTSAFPWGGAKNRDVMVYAIHALGRIGSFRTVAVLKTIVDDPDLGLPALMAIREIETVGTLAAAASERERR